MITDNRRFPIMGARIGTKWGTIPWAMIEPHGAAAQRNHGGQTLERLAERGGLCVQETLAAMLHETWDQRTYRDEPEACEQLAWLVREFEAKNGWRPMDTAPRNGQKVLIAVDRRAGLRGCMLVGHYIVGGHCIEDHPPVDEGWYFWNGCFFDKASKPLGWMPLPSAPETAIAVK